jgi:hypothetical protein
MPGDRDASIARARRPATRLARARWNQLTQLRKRDTRLGRRTRDSSS